MSPESIGISRNSIVLGKHSGKHAFEEKLVSLGYELSSEEINKLFIRFKDLADKKKVIFDRDIEALVAEKASFKPEWFRLLYHQVNSSNKARATAVVSLESSSGELEAVSFGDGPIDAVFKAVEKATGLKITLKDFQLKAVTSGMDALGEATIWIEHEGKVFSGRGLSTDVIEASVRGYVSAINGMLSVCGMPDKEE